VPRFLRKSNMWQSITSGETLSAAWTVIEEIERSLARHLTSDPSLATNPTLAGGTAGLALFYAYLDAARPGSEAGDRALDCLGQSIERLGSANIGPSLFSGFAGVGWTVEHLRRGFFDGDDDLADPIDNALEELLDRPGLQPYELLRGVAGYGVYLLERLPHPGTADLLVRVIDQLEASSERSALGCTWFTPPHWQLERQRQVMPGGCYNLGVAHGIPGVLGFLAAAHREGFDDPRLETLAEGTVGWLLAQCLEDNDESIFPAYFAPGVAPLGARTAWCYGDLGIAAILLLAGRSFGRPAWEQEAVDLAQAAAGRSPRAAGANDACLCHGAAGNGHLFARLAQATGDPVLREAALAWIRHALALRRPDEEIAGYPVWMPGSDDSGDWVADAGFLTGAAGVGLALLAAASDVEPEWDRVMLLSIPPRAETSATGETDNEGATE